MDTVKRDKLIKEFQKKHGLSDMDMKNLARYERTKETGEVNMANYLATMERYNANGGSKLVKWIKNEANYSAYSMLLIQISKL